MFLVPGELVTVRELLRGLIIISANDAALTLATHLGPGETGFVRQMNDKAKALGMMKSHFDNATGLSSPSHLSTARDLVVLAVHMIRDHPEFFQYSGRSDFHYKGFRKKNTNELLGELPVDGMKTGYTKAAGWCLMIGSKQGQRRLLAVVLGAASNHERFRAGRLLLQLGLMRVYGPEEGRTL